MKTLRAKIESSLADYITANLAGTSAEGLPVYAGDNHEKMAMPRVIAKCLQAVPEGAELEGLGNYLATAAVWVEHNAHEITADAHRTAAEAVKRLLLRVDSPTLAEAFVAAGVMPYEVRFEGDDMRRENDDFTSVFALRIPCVDNPQES